MAGFAAALAWSAPVLAVTKLAAEPEVALALTQKAAEPAAPPSVIDQVSVLASHLPEPADWVLMIVGFGGAGAALRLRRRRLAHR
jgi:hypothetical protein